MSVARRKKTYLTAKSAAAIAAADEKVSRAEFEAFMARGEAIDAILENATDHDAMMLCAQALARVLPTCCGEHKEEAMAEFLRLLSDCTRMQAEDDEARGEAEEEPPPQVH
jgi:hypothetical protein